MTLESLKVKYWFVSYYTYHPEIELMVSSEKRDIWTQTLSAMKVSLESSYEFKTVVHEESKLIEGLKDNKKDYVVFSGYRRNTGRRRLNDTKRVIDTALVKIVCCESGRGERRRRRGRGRGACRWREMRAMLGL